MVDPEEQYLKFRTWMLQPGALPEQRAEAGSITDIQTLLEDALWAAWQAGFREGALTGPEKNSETAS